MVAPINPRLGCTMPVNLARNFLARANELFQAGDIVAAGCYCREALRRFLESLCIYNDCLPTRKRTTPREMVDALLKKKVIDKDDKRLLIDLLGTCNRAAHAMPVKGSMMGYTICLSYSCLDHFRCLAPFERVCACGCKEKPAGTYDDGYGDDCDDDDGADWWKNSEGGEV